MPVNALRGVTKRADQNMLLRAMRDPEFYREDLLPGVSNALSGLVSGVAGAPVDLAMIAARPFGYSLPAEQTVLSSEWIGRKLGADTSAPAFVAGSIGIPDPKDAGALLAGVGAVARRSGKSGGGVQLPLGSRSEAVGDVLVEVDVSALDRAWERSGGLYIGRGGQGATPAKLQGAADDIAAGRATAPELSVDHRGVAQFVDGRHRTAVVRDSGAETMTVAIPRSELENARRAGIVVDAPPKQRKTRGRDRE